MSDIATLESSQGAPVAPDDPYAGRFAAWDGSLRRHTARGTIVNAAFLIGVSALNLLRGFIVASFITTGDYGVWGILSVVLGTLIWLKQVGINDKYVQQEEGDQELAFQKAFTLEAAFNAIFLVLLLLAIPIAVFVYGQDKILLPGVIAAVTVLPAVTLQSPIWIFYRSMEFVRQRMLQTFEPIVAFVVTIALAIGGAGYWSLVGGVIAGVWTGAIVAVRASPYRLRFRYDRGTLREYAGFSWPLFIGGASAIVIAQGSILTGEKTLGLAGAGFITLASSISLFANRVDDIVTQTVYPAICAIQGRTALLLETFVKSNRLALMWGIPFGVGVVLYAPDIVTFGIGEKWRPAVGLIQVFGLLAGLNQIGFNWHAFYRARNNTRPIAVANVAMMVAFLVAAVPLLVYHGLGGYALGMAIMTGVGIALRLYYLVKIFPGFHVARHILRAVAPTVPAVAVVLGLRTIENFDRTAGLALGEFAVYVGVTALATWFFERALLREIRGYLSRGSGAQPGVAT